MRYHHTPSGLISLGDYVAFNSYLTMIVAPVTSIGRIVNMLQRGLASLKRLNALMVQPELPQFDRVDDGVPIRGEVRTEQVGMLAARIATVPVVREVLREAQRAMGEATPLVVEGRDMGTVVFPDARFKFFLDASPEVRALRRLRDLAARGVEADLVTLTEQIRQRDSLDRNRAVAPLRPAADAVIVDTSELDIAGVLGVLVHRISVHEGSVTLLP